MEHISYIWPKMAALAADLGLPYQTVAAWKWRGRIPADYDLDLIEAARKRGHTLTLDQLAAARRANAMQNADHTPAHGPASASAQPSPTKKTASVVRVTGGGA